MCSLSAVGFGIFADLARLQMFEFQDATPSTFLEKMKFEKCFHMHDMNYPFLPIFLNGKHISFLSDFFAQAQKIHSRFFKIKNCL